ncbi:exonuclease 1 [Hevea brasiliensis]|uniref:exonuclease 1 n=1 Tax=Hevea brasiliensis TaxID=3981 RepID=UPI0025F7B7FB|nr:exonuclease 1 [Hevea brasiliensis]
MGIQGLLPLLKSIMVPIHIRDLDGCFVAVDTYSWLHKGALSCSTQLCKGLPTSRHIEYCMHRVNLLRHYGVKPILVFDGGLLPMKIEQENKRARARRENLARAIEHESNGNSAAAYECYQKAVDISPSIAHELIQILKQENVSYVVAPYEADAQMTFLAVSKQVDAVITEDSDLVPFGCPRIIFKMDKYGQGVEFHYSRLKLNKELSFAGFTHEMLLQMCILSGCDYLQSLPGMGLKRAHALIKKFKSYEKVIKHLRYSTASVPPLYEESFQKAIWTFMHQRVYDPTTEDIVHLSVISDNLGDDFDFLGPTIPQHIAKGIAKGDLDPFTQMPFKGENASSGVVLNRMSECKNFKPESGRKKLDLPVQKNVLTKYFCVASLEAKREFRAPRTSPINSSPVDNSHSPKEYCRLKSASSSMHCSSESPLDSENGGSTPPNDTVESGFAAEVLEFSESPTLGMSNEEESTKNTLLQQFGHSMHKTCEALLKECDCKNVQMPNAVEDKRTENKKVIVQSSYFNHKSKNKSDEDDKQEKLLVKDDVASDPFDSVILKSTYKTRAAKNKVVVRSSYFQHKSVNKNDQVNEQFQRLLVKDDAAMDNEMNDDIILESASSDNNGITMKRKTSPNDTVLRENMKPKRLHADGSLFENGCCPRNLDETYVEQKTEGKFGSNISHIDHYSDIAEKSMERFVSVISSFRFSSSGSRASGLRAPLKDIRNTCNSRSNADVDFSHYAYTPTNNKRQKTGIALRRC